MNLYSTTSWPEWSHMQRTVLHFLFTLRPVDLLYISNFWNVFPLFFQIRKGGYAFLWDSAVLDFVKQQKPCGILRPVGRPFGKSGYGFGLQKNSPYNRELSQHILELREKGFIEKLNNKWLVALSYTNQRN